jgi:pimeloyl-ACP methyl ester carboxylesterase
MCAERTSNALCLLRNALPRGTHAPRNSVVARRGSLEIEGVGRIAFYTNDRDSRSAARDRPLVLVHGMHPAAGSHELRPLFEALRGRRPLYVPDLPGFGRSQRGPREYTPALYVRAIEALIEYVGAEHAGLAQDGVDVLAVGLSCEYAAQAAVHLPDLVRSLLLISPTGFALLREQGRLERAARRGRRTLPMAVLDKLRVSPILYRALVGRQELSRALHRIARGRVAAQLRPQIDPQPGERDAVLALLGGQLFPQGNPQSVYTRVHCPTLILHADKPHAGFGSLACFVKWHEYFRAEQLSDVSLLTAESTRQVEQRARAFWEQVRELERADAFPDSWGEPADSAAAG